MRLKENSFYRAANGGMVWVRMNGPYYVGLNQTGRMFAYDPSGYATSAHSTRRDTAVWDLVEELPEAKEDDFHIFSVGSVWATAGDRLWKIVAICEDKNFPIVANLLLPDGTFHANIKKFNWAGQPHDGSASTLKRKAA